MVSNSVRGGSANWFQDGPATNLPRCSPRPVGTTMESLRSILLILEGHSRCKRRRGEYMADLLRRSPGSAAVCGPGPHDGSGSEVRMVGNDTPWIRVLATTRWHRRPARPGPRVRVHGQPWSNGLVAADVLVGPGSCNWRLGGVSCVTRRHSQTPDPGVSDPARACPAGWRVPGSTQRGVLTGHGVLADATITALVWPGCSRRSPDTGVHLCDDAQLVVYPAERVRHGLRGVRCGRVDRHAERGPTHARQ